MKIKVGDYVRTTTGEICKIEDILSPKDIKAHSPYIIDLIEPGDVIKYKELFDNEMFETKANETYILNLKSQKEVDGFKMLVEDKEIEFISIVTHEQFEDMEYEV